MIRLVLPFPPSANVYWRKVGGKMLVSKAAKSYRQQVGIIVRTSVEAKIRPITTAVKVSIVANPPNRRKRDIDNLLKATLDAMELAGLYVNDCQVHELTIRWGTVQRNANLEVSLETL